MTWWLVALASSLVGGFGVGYLLSSRMKDPLIRLRDSVLKQREEELETTQAAKVVAEQMAGEAKRTILELQTKLERLEELEEQVSVVVAERDGSRDELRAANERLRSIEGALSKASKESTRLDRELKESQRDHLEIRRKLLANTRECEEIKMQLAASMADESRSRELSVVQGDLEDVRIELSGLRGELDDARIEKQTALSELDAERRRIHELERQLDEQAKQAARIKELERLVEESAAGAATNDRGGSDGGGTVGEAVEHDPYLNEGQRETIRMIYNRFVAKKRA